MVRLEPGESFVIMSLDQWEWLAGLLGDLSLEHEGGEGFMAQWSSYIWESAQENLVEEEVYDDDDW